MLLSPSVFQQSATKAAEVENKAGSSSPLTLGTTEIQTTPPTVLSRSQLQEALIHLIKVVSIQSSVSEGWGSKHRRQHWQFCTPVTPFALKDYKRCSFLFEGADYSTLYTEYGTACSFWLRSGRLRRTEYLGCVLSHPYEIVGKWGVTCTSRSWWGGSWFCSKCSTSPRKAFLFSVP